MSDAQTVVALVVDDSPDTLGMLNEALEQAGIMVLMAMDGAQALKIAHLANPDIILLDAMMPNMDGFETCRRLKLDSQLADIPVIFMTGLSATGDVVRGLEAGGVDYLSKPVNPDELVARLHVHLGNARRTSSVQQALDRTGQHLVSLTRTGELQWATERAQALLRRCGSTPEQFARLTHREISVWMTHTPQRGQTLRLDALHQVLVVELQSDAQDEAWILRLIDPADQPSAQTLQRELPLTTRESEVLYWTAQGKTNREIGHILEMSPRTVNKHLEAVFTKLGVENRTSAATIAIRLLDRH